MIMDFRMPLETWQICCYHKIEVRYILWEELDLERQDSFHDSRGTAAVFHTSVPRKTDTQVIQESYTAYSKITNYRKYRTQYSPFFFVYTNVINWILSLERDSRKYFCVILCSLIPY